MLHGFSDSSSDVEKKLIEILKSAPIPIYEVEFPGTKFRFVNERLCKLLGYSEEELLALNPNDLLFDEDQIVIQQKVEEALRGENLSSTSAEIRVKAKNGKIHWGLITARVNFRLGKPDTVVIFAQDITDRKKAEDILAKKQEELQTIIDSSQGWIFYKDRENHFVQVNTAFAEIMGLPKEQINGRSIFELYPKEEAEAFWSDDKQVITSGKAKVGIVEKMQSKKGQRWVQTDKIPYRDTEGNIIGVIGFSVDITERKKAEEALDEYRKNLEKLVEERTKQLKEKERLAAIGATAGMVGHDIRNPLQAIAGDLYLIDNDVASLPEGETKEGLQESVKGIQDNLLYIAKIVEDLQDYAKPLKPNFERVKIDRVIEDVMLLIGNVTSNHRVIIDVETGFPEFVSDFSMLKRALTNLTQNAIQAMPDGGQLTLRANQKGARLLISVEDTGEGIPEEVKPKLFTPMVTTKSKGQGLGLAVVKRLVEALNGTVTFESQEGKGTKFIVELPTS